MLDELAGLPRRAVIVGGWEAVARLAAVQLLE
jgi:hypothetical protein